MTRTTSTVITEEFAELASVWPVVAARLTAMLRGRGVDHASAADVVQEVAARVISYRVPFADADDLYRWAAVVGWRLVIDARRRRLRIVDTPVPDVPSPTDTEAVVETRLFARSVVSALSRLSPSDRAAILDGIDPAPPADRRDAVRRSMRRHRARARLLALVKWLLPVWTAVRAIAGWVRARPARAAAIGAVPVVLAALVVPIRWPWRASPEGPGGTRLPAGVEERIVERAPASRLPALVEVAPAAPVAAVGSAPSRPASASSGSGTVPPIRVDIADPKSGTTAIGIRPKEPTDHLACLDTIVDGYRCADAPPGPYPTLP